MATGSVPEDDWKGKEGVNMVMEESDAKIDLEVAKAIGLKTATRWRTRILITSHELDELHGIEHTTCESGIACMPFNPSVDLNVAFAAAEKVGLFKGNILPSYRRCLFRANDDQLWEFGGPGILVTAATPSLAICAAILELKESK